MGFENAKAVAYLSWIDCLERFDVLIEELRNIQLNIAFQLKSEPLYFIIQYEEAFLDVNYEMLGHFYGFNKLHRKNLSFAIMPDFPMPKQLKAMALENSLLKNENENPINKLTRNCRSLLNTLNDNSGKGKNWENSKQANLLNTIMQNNEGVSPAKISKKVKMELATKESTDNFITNGTEAEELDLVLLTGTMTIALFQFWQATFWSLDQRQLYYNLRATQALKRAIFSDKLFLLKTGLSAFIEKTPDSEEKMYEMLAIRRTLLVKCQRYIKKLSAHQACVAENFEHGEQELTRPLVKRRRDQALYSRILNDLCANTFQEMVNLLVECNENVDITKRDVSLIHHWEHSYTSEYTSLYKPVLKVTHSYFKTSYWTPDRPDLQSAIIHEVGHIFTDEVFKRFGSIYFQENETEFASLFRRLKSLLLAYEVDIKGAGSIDLILQEIGVDILASSIKGPSYLYALALEILGEAIESMYGSTVDGLFERQLSLPNALVFSPKAFQWHFRLHIVCSWIELTAKDSQKAKPDLTDKLIDGVRNLADRLLKQIQKWFELSLGAGSEEHRIWNYHKDLKEALCGTVSSSLLPVLVRRHLKRKGDIRKNKHLKTKALHSFSTETQSFLFNGLLGHKKRFWDRCDEAGISEQPQFKEHGSTLDYARFFFDKNYGVKIGKRISSNEKIKYKYEHINIFKFLHDIPWQCALMKGIDFVNITKGEHDEATPVAYKLMRPALGRGVYQSAVDFFYHEVENPLYHLEEVSRQLAPLSKPEPKSIMHTFFQKLNSAVNTNATIKEIQTLSKGRGTSLAKIKESLRTPQNNSNKNALKEASEILRKAYEETNNSFESQLKILQITKSILKAILAELTKSLDIHLFRIQQKLSLILNEMPHSNIDKALQIIIDLERNLVTERYNKHHFMNKYAPILNKKWEDNTKHIKASYKCINDYLTENWDVDICQMHSFLSSIYDSEEKEKDLLCLAMSQHHLCADIANIDTDNKLIGGASIWSLNKVTTAHLHKIPLSNVNTTGPLPSSRTSVPSQIMDITPVFGKYDFMSITPEIFPSTIRIGDLGIFNENAFPFFMRKETVLPVCLKNFSNKDTNKDNPEDDQTLALICVRMNRSTWRLHFLLRIIKSFIYLNEKIRETDGTNKNWEARCCDLKIAQCLNDTDRIYLSDGSSDLFFEIKGDAAKRFDDIFNLKDALFDDFQTSLVETLPGAALFAETAKNPNFRMILSLQVRQSRSLKMGLKNIKNKLLDEFSEHIEEMYALHGKMDFKIVLKNMDKIPNFNSFSQRIITVCHEKINCIQLALEKKLTLHK